MPFAQAISSISRAPPLLVKTAVPLPPGDAYAQACRCFEVIQATLTVMNASLHQVVRTRMYVTDISQWATFGKAHQEFFGEHPPVTSMVEVSALISADMLIEVEAEAFVA